MGKSKTKTVSKSNETATVAPNQTYSPYIDQAAATLAPAYQVAQANNAHLMGGIDSALGYSNDVLSGKYLKGNPYLDAVVNKANQDITNTVNSRFESTGRYGSGMYADVLARDLADNENQLRYQNYATERGYQNAAPGQIAQLSSVSAALPQAASSAYADAVKSLLGGYTTGTQVGNSTSKTTSSPSLLSILASAAASAGQAAAGA